MELVEAFWAALRGGGEEPRWVLVKSFLSSPERVLEEIRRRVGGELVPDTVVASRAVEVVLAALAARGRVRLVIPSSPVPGWGPLLALAEELPRLGLGDVYSTPFWPSSGLRAVDVVRRVARVFRGAAVRIVDVTDASPLAVAAAQPGGARWLTVLADMEYTVVFEKFWFTK
jgi:hypothetical protein